MPGNILNADTGFPQFEQADSVEAKLGKVMNYLYMLLEQLRYTLENLGAGNFNEAELDNLTHLITDPVMVRLTDAEGNLAALDLTAQGLTTRVANAEGNISTVQQTAQGLTSQVSSMAGEISTVQQTAQGLTTRVSDAEGNIAAAQIAAEVMINRISNAEGDISQVEQTANKINWLVRSGTSSSNFTMTDRAISQVSQNITLDADQINLNGDTTLQATNGDDELVTEIDGNSITMYCNPDSGGSESLSRMAFKVNTGSSNNQAADIFLKNYGSGSDEDSRFALVVSGDDITYDGDRYYVSIKLTTEQSISLEAYEQIFLRAYGSANGSGSITMEADDVVAIRPSMDFYDASRIYGTDGFLFCSDGLYFDGTRIS